MTDLLITASGKKSNLDLYIDNELKKDPTLKKRLKKVSKNYDKYYSKLRKKSRTLTEEQEIILSCWYQWAYETKRGRYAGGLSALESCESYLREYKIINSLGNKAKDIIW